MSSERSTSFHRYPAKSLMGDYLRALLGLVFALAVLFSSEPNGVVLVIFGGTAALLSLFLLRTLRQQFLQVAINEEGVFTRLLGTRSLPWRELRQVKLRYFGTRRQRRQGSGLGFLQLTLRGNGPAMSFESNLEGFEDLLRRTALAVREKDLPLDQTTAGNFQGLGIELESATQTAESEE